MSLEGLNPQDTFNLITFAGDTRVLFDGPVAPTQANMDRARQFLDEQEGDGGTEMMKAVKAALDPTDATDHIRIVCFMTDGFIGNETEIIAEIQKHPKARVFSFGIGSSVNRFLLDKMAEAGNGEVEYVSLEDDGSKAAKRFYERVRTPLLTDISIDWNGLPVADVYPSKLPDLFSAKPVVVIGRYSSGATGSIRLRGKVGGREYSREIAVTLPEKESANDSIASLWARNRVATLSMEKLKGNGETNAAQFDKLIADLGLEFRLLTNFTSFVAVEDRIVNQNGAPVTVEVPAAVPAGVDAVKSGANVDVTSNSTGPAVSTEFFSNIPTSRTIQGLYTIAPTASRSGLGSARNPSSGSGTGSGSGSGSGSAGAPMSGLSATVTVSSSEEETSSSATRELIANATVEQAQQAWANRNPSVAGSSGPENSFILDGMNNVGVPKNVGRSENLARAVLIVEPEYPETAGSPRKKSEVHVDVDVDVQGNVASARAISGPAAFRQASELAAKLSKFAPANFNGRPVRLRGTIAYKFAGDAGIRIRVVRMNSIPLSADEKFDRQLRNVMHFRIYRLVSQSNKNSLEAAGPDIDFVHQGQARIRVELSKDSQSARNKLAAAGLQIISSYGMVVTGVIPLSKLKGLARLAEVRYISTSP